MKAPAIPENESERLKAVQRLDILDSAPEAHFDDLTRLASLVCGTLFSTVSIIDEDRQWFKSVQGPLGAKETGRDISFCGHALNSPDLLIVEDASKDDRFADNPFVESGPGIRFYAGAPLVLDNGLIAGTLCVFDPKPKTLDPDQQEGLRLLAKQVTDRLKKRISDAITNRLSGILALGDTHLVVFDPRQEEVSYLSPGLQLALESLGREGTRPLFARLFPDLDYDRYFSRERLNDSELGLRTVTKVCLPAQAPGQAELRLFVSGADNRSTCILGFRDRTELTRTRDSAEQAQSNLRVFHQLALQSLSSFTVTGADGKIQWVNTAFEKLTGYRLDEIQGRKPGDFLQGGETSNRDKERISKHLRDGQAVVQEILNYTKWGQPYWTELYIEPILDDVGHLTHYVATQTDITKRRKENQVLRQSRARAEQENREKSQFLAKISHELRTPLNGIVGITEKLFHEVPENLRDSAAALDQSSQHLMTILNDLLDLSHIESGDLELAKDPFNLVRLMQDTEQLFAPRAEMVGTQLHLQLDENLPTWVAGDEVRLRQVLINLMSNAVKFAQRGHVELNASLAAPSGPLSEPHRITFSVSDDGPGIAAEDQQRIFQSFEQLDNSSTRTHGGTGLGLAISEQLVDAMGGQLSLTSELGQGTTFFFELPLAACADSLATAEGASQPPALPQTPLEHALVIDDNQVNCKVIEDLLQRLGCTTVHTGQSARRGMAILENIQPDVVITDLQMPDLSGFDFVAYLQQLFTQQNRTMPVLIACSADASSEIQKQCLAAGFDAHLGKPVTGVSLHKVITQLGFLAKNPDYPGAHLDSSINAGLASKKAANQSPIDREALMSSFLGNEDLLGEFLTLLKENLPTHSQRIEEALKTRSVTAHADAAHSIKGLVGYFQNEELIRGAEELENAMISGNSETAAQIYKPLRINLIALDREIKRLLREVQ